MRALINDNEILGKDLDLKFKNFLPEDAAFAVKQIRARYHYNEEKQKTDAIDAYVYTVTEMKTLATLDIRVNSTTPVITPEELENAEERVFIEFPLEETFVRPYRLEYGRAKVSIVAPYATLATPSDSAEEED